MLQRPFRKRTDQLSDSCVQTAHDGVRERDRPLEPCTAHQLDGFVYRSMRRNARGVGELIRAEAQRRANGRIQLAQRAAPEFLDRVVERANALHGAVGEALRERTIARVEPFRCRAQHAIGVRIVLEHTQDYLVRSLPRSHRTPRRNSSYVMRRLPSGCTSSRTSRPSSTPVRQTRTRRPSTMPPAPMCGESARTRLWSSSAGRLQSSSRSPAVIFSAYVTPSSSWGTNVGPAST